MLLVPRAAVRSRAHFSTSRWPPSAASVQVRSSPRQGAVRARPLQHLQVAANSAASCASLPRPTERRSRAPTAASPGGRLSRPMVQVDSSHGQGGSLARAHCSTSRWPLSAAARQVLSSHGSAGRRAPTAAPPGGRHPAAPAQVPRLPRSAVRSQPLQHLQVAAYRGYAASLLVPRASSFLRPPRDLHVPTPRDARERRSRPTDTLADPSPTPACRPTRRSSASSRALSSPPRRPSRRRRANRTRRRAYSGSPARASRGRRRRAARARARRRHRARPRRIVPSASPRRDRGKSIRPPGSRRRPRCSSAVEATSRRDDLGVREQHFATRPPQRRRRERRKRTRPSSRARRVTRRDDSTRAFLCCSRVALTGTLKGARVGRFAFQNFRPLIVNLRSASLKNNHR